MLTYVHIHKSMPEKKKHIAAENKNMPYLFITVRICFFTCWISALLQKQLSSLSLGNKKIRVKLFLRSQ